MSSLSDARRPEVTFPEYYRVASVGPQYVEGDIADVFRVVFVKEAFSDALQALSESQKRLRKGDYRASIGESRNALQAARTVVGRDLFLKRLDGMKLPLSYSPVIEEVLRGIPPLKAINSEKATLWFTVVNDIVQQLTKG